MDEPPDTPAIQEPADADHRRRIALRKAARATGLLGVAFALLFLASMWEFSQIPGPGSSNQEIFDFYASNDKWRVILVGLYLLPLSAVAFIWFIAALRESDAVSGRRYSRMLGNVQLVSGIGFITLTFASTAAHTVIAASVEFADAAIDPSAARQFPIYGDALLFVFAMRMAAIFVMTTTNIGRAGGFYPRWFVVVSLVVAAVLFLSASLSLWFVLIFPLWVLLVGGLI